MIVGIPRETFPDERRVAMVPALVPRLMKKNLEVIVQSGAGSGAGFTDAEFTEKGAHIVADRAEVFGKADVILQVRALGANVEAGRADLALMRRDQVIVGFAEPLGAPKSVVEMAERGVMTFAIEFLPRITRAQSMDALSSQATVAGYKAVLQAADALPRMFPMMMTAAGTITPARVLVIGAGVAGLQAIASAKRIGAVVQAYDVRPAVKEQIESLGAKFVELPLETAGAEDKGGYAKAMDESFYRKQSELLGQVVRGCDVVITTAVVPGKPAPVLVTRAMVESMAPGSVIVDLAAERGGNCELTQAGRTVVEHGVTIMGPTNLPATVPYHASQMYAKNLSEFILPLVKDGQLQLNLEDEIVRGTLLTRGGEVVHPRVRELLGLSAAPTGAGKQG